MAICITGAGGFTGRALLNRLAPERKQIKALIRKNCPGLPDSPDIKYIKGDIRSPVIVSELLEECGCLIHLAAVSQGDASGLKEMEEINLKASENLFLKAADYGISRIIYVSAASVHQSSEGIISEEAPLKTKGANPYEDQKIKCEKILKQIGGDFNIDIVILRPVTVYGPGDKRLLPFLQMIKSSRVFMIGHGENSVPLLYVEDFINAISAAIDHPLAINQEYIVSGRDLTAGDMVSIAGRELNVSPELVHLPAFPSIYAAKFIESVFPSLGISSPFGNEGLSFFTGDLKYSSEKLVRELGVRLDTPHEDGIAETIKAYRASRQI